MSAPEPPPKNIGYDIGQELLKELQVSQHEDARKLVKERIIFGIKKYGQPLRSQDGRDGIEDARQELGDLMMYVMKCKVNNISLDPLKPLVATLVALFFDDCDLQ